MKEERISNYVKLCEEWAQRFLKMDQADLHKRVPELKEENGFLTIIHFGRRYLYASGVCERGGFYYG